MGQKIYSNFNGQRVIPLVQQNGEATIIERLVLIHEHHTIVAGAGDPDAATITVYGVSKDHNTPPKVLMNSKPLNLPDASNAGVPMATILSKDELIGQDVCVGIWYEIDTKENFVKLNDVKAIFSHTAGLYSSTNNDGA